VAVTVPVPALTTGGTSDAALRSALNDIISAKAGVAARVAATASPADTLIYNCASPDVLVVHITPIRRREVPTTARDIMNRINEISFNSSLMREMRAIAFVSRLIEDGKLNDPEIKPIRIHSIEAEEIMQKLSVASKLNADWEFLLQLHATGRERTSAWLAGEFSHVGVKATVNVHEQYL
jgi:NTE family protein